MRTVLNGLIVLMVALGVLFLLAAAGLRLVGVGSALALTSGFAYAEYRGRTQAARVSKRKRLADETVLFQQTSNDGDWRD